jgi:ABC-type Fe3+ transport system substrate-binding protein
MWYGIGQERGNPAWSRAGKGGNNMQQSLGRRAALGGALALPLAASLPRAARAIDPGLIAAARQEGTVVWYSTLIVNQLVRPAAEAFMKKYPGINVQYSRQTVGEIVLKISNESRAGKLVADVFDGSSGIFASIPRSMVAAYATENAADYDPDMRDPAGTWTTVNSYVYTTGYNTEMVAEKDAPKTFQDLLDPKWRGKMAITTDPTVNGPPGLVGTVLTGMGKKDGMEFLRRLGEQNLVYVPASQRVVLDQVIAGQYPIGLMIINYHAVISAAQGAPCAWIKMEPVVESFNYLQILKDAPHPNAARLLAEFLLSREGQTVFRDNDYLPGNHFVQAKDPTLKPSFGKFRSTQMTIEQAQNLPEWTRIADALLKK